MNTSFPDTKTIGTVLEMAARAPSIYNSQPWRWRVSDDKLDLYVDASLHLPSTDPDGRDLIVSCGAALNHCVVALAAMGWRARAQRLPDPGDPDHLATIETCGCTIDPVDVMLAAAIPRRRTDRRTYGPWPVPAGDIALMGARAARAGVILRRLDSLDALNSIVAQAVRSHLTDREYLAELTTWSGRYGSRAGVPARNTPTPEPTAALPSRVFAGPMLAQPPDVSPADENAVILALGTRTDDRLSRLRAGEATSIVLLTATSMGLASCPVTEPLEIRQTREALRTEVFGAGGHPQMLLRVGWAPINADPLPPTPRRELDAIVQWRATTPAAEPTTAAKSLRQLSFQL